MFTVYNLGVLFILKPDITPISNGEVPDLIGCLLAFGVVCCQVCLFFLNLKYQVNQLYYVSMLKKNRLDYSFRFD